MWNSHPGAQPGIPNNTEASNGMNLGADDSVQRDRLNQIFNTALVSSRGEAHPNSASEIQSMMGTPAFGSILQAIQLLAGEQGTSELEAARDVIRTFRKMDALWTEYLVTEGVERLKSGN